MNGGKIMLQARALDAGYKGKAMLRQAEPELRAGEVLAVIGPNGAGKTTLLRTLTGQLEPVAGTVLLEGKDMRALAPAELARQMAVLLTERPRAELMSCREAAAAGRYPYTGLLGILSEEDREKVDGALRRMGALELADRPFDGISDGQRQRVLLARALCQEPQVLLLDEPASFLDIRFRLELAQALRSLAHEEGIAILVSLHELELVRRCADRVLCLKDGRADRICTPDELYRDGYLERLFGLPAGSLDPGGLADGRSGGTAAAGTQAEEKEAGDGPAENERSSALHPPKYVRAEGKLLRCGFTTGTCAALAAAGAARRLLTGILPETVSLVTPAGIRVEVPLELCAEEEDSVTCGVRKDAGDDVDCTAGILIKARVSRGPYENGAYEAGGAGAAPGSISGEGAGGKASFPKIRIEGGEGVGTVTKPGLELPVGSAAINPVPRRMIAEAAAEACRAADYDGALTVTVCAEGGQELAKKTFNPDLGIEGGISILGTSGIVEPMSRRALTETVALELRQRRAEGHRRVILVPGNYGTERLRELGLDGLGVPVVKCSNFIGEALDEVSALGYEEVLLAGHSGKLVKLAGGIMNTHSREADCRRELICAHAAACGAGPELCRQLLDCVSTDACMALLERHGLLETVMERLMEAVRRHLRRRVPEDCRIGAMMFTGRPDRPGKSFLTREAEELAGQWKRGKER